MTDDEFDEFVAQANAELAQKQATLEKTYGLGRHDRFVVEYDKRRLTFFGKEGPLVEAVIVPVATHVETQNSLKWSWSSPQLPQAVREDAARVRKLYDLTGYEIFANETAECDASMAWEITAMACKLLSALGAYRVPHANLNAYMLITEIKVHTGVTVGTPDESHHE